METNDASKTLRETHTDEELQAMGWKHCTKCLELKPANEFYKGKRRNGLSYTCRKCHRVAIRGYRNVVDSYNWWYRRFEKLRKNARKRGLEFTLTVDDLREIKSLNECVYCGVETDVITIDRKDNSKGYTPENVQATCFYCNRLKSDMFDDFEMSIIAKAIRHKHERDRIKNEQYEKQDLVDNSIDLNNKV